MKTAVLKPSEIENKRVFLVVSSSPEKIQLYSKMVTDFIQHSTVFTAEDGVEALFKIANVTPHVIIADAHLTKLGGLELCQQILHNHKEKNISVIVISEWPEKDQFVDEVVTGQVQFLVEAQLTAHFGLCLNRALNRISLDEDSSYHLKFLSSDEILFREGELARSVFVVKKGELVAYKQQSEKTVVLGSIGEGEFVGEMAHFNGEPRSATVKALKSSELIEIPSGTLDMVLFSKPAWSKALIATLSKRLKKSNNRNLN